jgi:hypothetical protein
MATMEIPGTISATTKRARVLTAGQKTDWAGISEDKQQLCFGLALWNGDDPILKERLFGLTNCEGNEGEDVKEYYFYLDSTPTHSDARRDDTCSCSIGVQKTKSGSGDRFGSERPAIRDQAEAQRFPAPRLPC